MNLYFNYLGNIVFKISNYNYIFRIFKEITLIVIKYLQNKLLKLNLFF